MNERSRRGKPRIGTQLGRHDRVRQREKETRINISREKGHNVLSLSTIHQVHGNTVARNTWAPVRDGFEDEKGKRGGGEGGHARGSKVSRKGE